MTGYVGEYGEGFLGVGYSHSSFANESTDGKITHSGTAEAGSDNGYSYYGPGEGETSEVCFVAATLMDHSDRIEPETSGPGQHQQQQKQRLPQNNTIEEEAKLARLKAMDIVRNILHGDGEPSNHGTCGNQPPEIPVNNNHAYGYYGPSAGSANNGYTSQSELATNGGLPFLSPPPPAASIESDAQARRLEAMKVLQKFQLQQQQQPPSTVASAAVPSLGQSREPSFPNSVQYSGPSDTEYIPIEEPRSILRAQSHGQPHHQSLLPPTMIPSPTPPATPPWEMARKRRECLDRHEERKQGALFKNLEYVARLEEERLRQQLHQVQEVQTLEAQIDNMYRQKLAFRQQQQQQQARDGRNTINTSAAGIGTKERQKAERKRKRTALPPSLRKQHSKNNSNNNSNSNGSSSVAIYVSNLPTDGSVDDSTIEALFASYGSLRKVHFYVDKTNGKRKGDALVLYSLNSDGDDNEEARLTEAVCSQVNGCELPGGAILSVQPSDPYHKVTDKLSKNVSGAGAGQRLEEQPMKAATHEDSSSLPSKGENSMPVATSEENNTSAEKENGGDEEEEDLDDFFASLE